MSDIALLLGPIVFRDFEVPSGINFGGKQRLVLHRLPGGSRIIDSLGRDDAQISFAGIFTGSDATLRARGLDEMRVTGLPLPLTWDVFFYTVIISEFRADYRSGSWIPYQIVCTVLHDEASALLQQGISLATAVVSDVAMAAVFAADGDVDLGTLTSGLTSPGATVRGTAPYAVTQAGFADAQSSIDASIADANVSLDAADIAGAGTAQAGINGLLQAADATQRLSSLSLASAYIRRASINLASAST